MRVTMTYMELADLSMSAIEAALCPLGEHLSCEMCKKNLAERVKQLVVQWSVVKVCHQALVRCVPLYAGARGIYDAHTDPHTRRGRYDDVNARVTTL